MSQVKDLAERKAAAAAAKIGKERTDARDRQGVSFGLAFFFDPCGQIFLFFQWNGCRPDPQLNFGYFFSMVVVKKGKVEVEATVFKLRKLAASIDHADYSDHKYKEVRRTERKRTN